MEGFQQKHKVTFLAYEFLGAAFTTIAFNLCFGQVAQVFIFSLLAWELSCAHFNAAITIGAFFYKYDEIKNNVGSFFLIVFT